MTKLWGIGLFMCLLLTSCAGQGSLEKALALCVDCKSIEDAIEFEKGLGSTLIKIDSVGIEKSYIFARPRFTLDEHEYFAGSVHAFKVEGDSLFGYYSSAWAAADTVSIENRNADFFENYDPYPASKLGKEAREAVKRMYSSYEVVDESREGFMLKKGNGVNNTIIYKRYDGYNVVGFEKVFYLNPLDALGNLPTVGKKVQDVVAFEIALGSTIIADTVRLSIMDDFLNGDRNLAGASFNDVFGVMYFQRPKNNENTAPLIAYHFGSENDTFNKCQLYWTTKDSLYLDNIWLSAFDYNNISSWDWTVNFHDSLFTNHVFTKKEIEKVVQRMVINLQKASPVPCYTYSMLGESDNTDRLSLHELNLFETDSAEVETIYSFMDIKDLEKGVKFRDIVVTKHLTEIICVVTIE